MSIPKAERKKGGFSFEHFHQLFDNNPALMAISDAEDNRLLDVNAAFLEKLGFTKEEVIGKTDFEISIIMARSRATVRFHIHNASIKLNAVNRSQSVFKAAQLGYISLGPW